MGSTVGAVGAEPGCAAPRSCPHVGREPLAISEVLSGLVGRAEVSGVPPSKVSPKCFSNCPGLQTPHLGAPWSSLAFSALTDTTREAGRTAPTVALASPNTYHGIPPRYTSPPNTHRLTSTKQVTFKNKHNADIQRGRSLAELGWPGTAAMTSGRRD